MILAITTFKEKSLNVNSIKQDLKGNLYSTANSKLFADSFTNFKQINQTFSFTGLNSMTIGKKIAGIKSPRLGRKINRFAEESIISIKSAFRKLKGLDELPFSKKPLIAPKLQVANDLIGDAIKYSHITGDSNVETIKLLSDLDKYNINIPEIEVACGHPVADNGYLLKHISSDILKQIDKKLANGIIEPAQAEKLKERLHSQTSFSGKVDINNVDIPDTTNIPDAPDIPDAPVIPDIPDLPDFPGFFY